MGDGKSAINVTGIGAVTFTLADCSANKLTDGSNSSESMSGHGLDDFLAGGIIINGDGKLTATGGTDETSGKHGIYANGAITIEKPEIVTATGGRGSIKNGYAIVADSV